MRFAHVLALLALTFTVMALSASTCTFADITAANSSDTLAEVSAVTARWTGPGMRI